jgi:hypothetical protein
MAKAVQAEVRPFRAQTEEEIVTFMGKLAQGIALAAIFIATPALADETITYTYDVHGRLVQVAHAGTVNSGVQTTYSYDTADNRTNKTTTGGAP